MTDFKPQSSDQQKEVSNNYLGYYFKKGSASTGTLSAQATGFAGIITIPLPELNTNIVIPDFEAYLYADVDVGFPYRDRSFTKVGFVTIDIHGAVVEAASAQIFYQYDSSKGGQPLPGTASLIINYYNSSSSAAKTFYYGVKGAGVL